jgi:hypothetical protein
MTHRTREKLYKALREIRYPEPTDLEIVNAIEPVIDELVEKAIQDWLCSIAQEEND